MDRIPESEWEWYGFAGHFICGWWCRYHLVTKVGLVIVSTVGKFVHPRHSQGNERSEREWLKTHPQGEEVGCDRFYETMVFKAGNRCDSAECGCGETLAADGDSLDFWPANSGADARANHMKACQQYAESTTQQRLKEMMSDG